MKSYGFLAVWLQHPELLNILQQPHNDEEDGGEKDRELRYINDSFGLTFMGTKYLKDSFLCLCSPNT